MTPSPGQPARWKYAYSIHGAQKNNNALNDKPLIFKEMRTELAMQFMMVGRDHPMTDYLHGHWKRRLALGHAFFVRRCFQCHMPV